MMEVFAGVDRKEDTLIETTAKVIIMGCLICLAFALICSVIAFVSSSPVGFLVIPLVGVAAMYLVIRYLQKTE